MLKTTTSQAFFEDMYRAAVDPWNFAGSQYELQRYDSIIAALGSQRISLALEPGCSVGVLTGMIASRCDRVLAFDISPTAVERAKQRCASLPNVTVSQLQLSDCIEKNADLLLLSEVGYYFQPAELRRLITHYVERLAPGATVLACHWLGHSPDHLIHGDQVHQSLHKIPSLLHEFSQRQQEFRIDRWRKGIQ